MKCRFITLRRAGIAWHLSFNRPERRNALNHAMMIEIGDAVDRVGSDRKARALVLRGTGGAYCAGGDLGAMSDLPPKPRNGPDPLVANYRLFGEVLAKLNALPQAVVSVVEGPAVGGGLGMVSCSDVVILHRSAKFGIPEPRSGFIPSQVLPFLVRRLGQYLCATAPALERALKAVLRDIGKMEPDALATAKRLTLMCATNSDETVMDRASVELVRLLRRPEALAGMRAFLLKKPPPWAR